MSEGILTKNGRLQDKLLPAIYFDTSVAIDYWMTEEWLEEPEKSPDSSYGARGELISKRREYLRKLLKSDIRLRKVNKIKEKLDTGNARATAVISPICLMELAEWHAEARFKQAASEEAGATSIQRKSKKEIGEYLSRLFSLILKERFEVSGEAKEAALLFMETIFPVSYAENIAFRGLLQADIVNFSLFSRSVAQGAVAGIYAYVQVGATDILHILVAEHLGCNYIASFDTDFYRIKELIKVQTGIELLSTPEEILSVL